MLRKMKKAAAWVMTSALLLSIGTPANAYAADPVYIVSEDDLKDGKLEIKGGSYAKIVVPEGLQAEEISLNGVNVAEFVVEGGIDAEINVSGGSIAKMQVEEIKEEMPTLRDKAKLISEGKSKSEAGKAYKEKKQEVKEKKEKTPEIALKDDAAVKTIGVSGNAKLELADGKVDTIAVSAKSSDMKVTVDGFKGKLVVEQKAEKSGAGHSTVELELNNSTIEKTEIIGDGSASIVVSGAGSTITEAIVGGETNLVLDVETKKLVTTEDSKNVALVILATVIEVVINGADTSMNLTANAKVTIAFINGDNATVEGTGKVETVVTDNETVKVEIEDTVIKTPAEVTPTTVPVVVPTTAPSTGGGGGSWYPTATPVPTETPDKPTVTPTPGEEEETAYAINVSYDETKGSVVILVDGKEATKAASGSAVTVTATANKDYKVESVTVDNQKLEVTSDGTYKFTMPGADVKVTVNFVAKEPTVTPTPGEDEEEATMYAINVSCDETKGSVVILVDEKEATKVASGSAVTVKATVKDGYKLSSIIVQEEDSNDYILKTPNSECTFTMPAANVVVYVDFYAETTSCEHTNWTAEGTTLTCTCGKEITAQGSSSSVKVSVATSGALSATVGGYKVELYYDVNDVITTTASNSGLAASSTALQVEIIVNSYTYNDANAPFSNAVLVEANLISNGVSTPLTGSFRISVNSTKRGFWSVSGGAVSSSSSTSASVISGTLSTYYYGYKK